jgi:SNF family Na+-dependent transporter
MEAFAQWLAGTPFSQGVARTLWLIPMLQSIHILGIAAVLSSVAMIELCIAGLVKSQTMSQTAHRFLPWLWAGLLLLAVSGILLIIGEPKRSLPNPAFQLKMLMLALAVLIALAFQTSLRPDRTFWARNSDGRRLKNVMALLAFLLWCAIAVAGRWIAYIRVD